MRRSDLTLRLRLIGLAALCLATPAAAETTEPAAAQPVLPSSALVDGMVDKSQPPLDVHKRALRRPVSFHQMSHHHVGHTYFGHAPVDRPALSGVTLVAPLPPPGEPPHIAVPLPAYPLDSLVSALTTPAPAIVCHHVRRDPDAPDPHLYREATVACEADNP